MASLEGLSVMIVFPDLMGKTKLREVMKAILYKSEIEVERDLKTLTKKIADKIVKKTDVIFVSSKFPQQEISAFIRYIAASDMQGPPAVAICLPGITISSSGLVAGWYMDGAAGFISEPFAASEIAELLNTILEKSHKKDPVAADIKARKAARFLLNDAVFLVDDLAKLRSQGKEGGYVLKGLRQLSESFRSFYAQDVSGYEEALIDTFEKIKPPAESHQGTQKKALLKVIKHPGAIVWDLMSERKLTEDRMAGLLHIEVHELNDLLWGKTDVDEKLSQSLSRALGMSPREWLKMQADYDVYKEQVLKSKD